MSFKKLFLAIIGIIFLFYAFSYIGNSYSLYKARGFVDSFIANYQDDNLSVMPYLSDDLQGRFPADPNAARKVLEADFLHGFRGAKVGSVKKVTDGIYDATIQVNGEDVLMLQFREVGDSYRITYFHNLYYPE